MSVSCFVLFCFVLFFSCRHLTHQNPISLNFPGHKFLYLASLDQSKDCFLISNSRSKKLSFIIWVDHILLNGTSPDLLTYLSQHFRTRHHHSAGLRRVSKIERTIPLVIPTDSIHHTPISTWISIPPSRHVRAFLRVFLQILASIKPSTLAFLHFVQQFTRNDCRWPLLL